MGRVWLSFTDRLRGCCGASLVEPAGNPPSRCQGKLLRGASQKAHSSRTTLGVPGVSGCWVLQVVIHCGSWVLGESFVLRELELGKAAPAAGVSPEPGSKTPSSYHLSSALHKQDLISSQQWKGNIERAQIHFHRARRKE